MTIYHVSNDTGFFTGNVFNALLRPSDVLFAVKSLFKSAGWQLKQSGDGAAAYSSSGDVLSNATYNQNDGGPDLNQIQFNSPDIANSICNQDAYFVVETPSGTPAKYRYQLCFRYLDSTSAGGAYYVRWEVRFSKGGFQNGTATTQPSPITSGDVRTLTRDSAGLYILYELGDFNDVYWNMGVSDDANNPFFWLEGHVVGGSTANPCMAFGDTIADPPLNENGAESEDGAVVFFRNNYVLNSALNFITQFHTAEIDTASSATLDELGIATSFQGFTQACCAITYAVLETGAIRTLVDDSGFYGLGLNSRNSNREDMLFIEYAVPQTAAYINRGGYCGRSNNFKWHTKSSPVRAHLSLGNNGTSVAWVLLSRLWVPFNNGASPGVNSVAFIL